MTLPRIEIPLIDDDPVARRRALGQGPADLPRVAARAAARLVPDQRRAPGCGCARSAPRPTRRTRSASPTLRIRDASTVVAGALAGLAGGQLALGLVGLFDQGMVAGRGFIALAAFYFGRARPWPTAAACALFALFDALQIRFQQEGLSSQLMSMIPYLVVIVVLTLTALAAQREAARGGRRMTPALLLVDVIRAFFDEEGIHHYAGGRTPSRRRSRRLLERARERDRLVVHAVERHRPGLADFEQPKLPEHCLIGGRDAEFWPGFEPVAARPRDRRAEAPLQRVLRHRPRAAAARAGRRHGGGRGGQDQRVHPRDLPGRVRARLPRGAAAGGHRLQPPAPGRGEPGGRAALPRRDAERRGGARHGCRRRRARLRERRPQRGDLRPARAGRDGDRAPPARAGRGRGWAAAARRSPRSSRAAASAPPA